MTERSHAVIWIESFRVRKGVITLFHICMCSWRLAVVRQAMNDANEVGRPHADVDRPRRVLIRMCCLQIWHWTRCRVTGRRLEFVADGFLHIQSSASRHTPRWCHRGWQVKQRGDRVRLVVGWVQSSGHSSAVARIRFPLLASKVD